MANIVPFEAYRYSAAAGPLENLVTQPYDKISPAMQARYLAKSPYNIVRIILGERFATDTEESNVYTRASDCLNTWIRDHILVRDDGPAFYAYFQDFSLPDSGDRIERKGFIGLGPVEEYSAGVVYRHEQTLSGPKKDRLELLRHTHAHFGQIFMLYPDRDLEIDECLEEAAQQAPLGSVVDEYDTMHRLWRIADRDQIVRIQSLMADRKLLIADGHHRYETALAFRRSNPSLAGSDRVMMTFVNMYSPGLRILATHRVLHGVRGFEPDLSTTRELSSLDELKRIFATPAPDRLRIGVVRANKPGITLVDRPRTKGELDVVALHQEFLQGHLGLSEDAIRDEKHIEYVRGLDAAYERVREGGAELAFLLEPTSIDQVAEVAFSGGVMPQKSTDFYPKLLSGLTIYKLPDCPR